MGNAIFERTIARGRRVDPDRDIARAAADFYLLENLTNIRGDRWAGIRLDQHERTLAREFASYLDMAVGGELRYARRYLCDLPNRLDPYFREISESQRGKAWLVWTIIRRVYGLEALAIAEEIFLDDGWRSNFGGASWARVARALREYLEGRIRRRIFVDRCFALEHNTGTVFNKLYDVQGLPAVLEAHGQDDYPVLLSAASPEVRRRWQRHECQARAAHDPIWLGVQIMGSYDTVA